MHLWVKLFDLNTQQVHIPRPQNCHTLHGSRKDVIWVYFTKMMLEGSDNLGGIDFLRISTGVQYHKQKGHSCIKEL